MEMRHFEIGNSFRKYSLCLIWKKRRRGENASSNYGAIVFNCRNDVTKYIWWQMALLSEEWYTFWRIWSTNAFAVQCSHFTQSRQLILRIDLFFFTFLILFLFCYVWYFINRPSKSNLVVLCCAFVFLLNSKTI